MSRMYLKLGDITVCLDSTDKNVQAYWRDLFGNWVQDNLPAADIQLTIHMVETLPPLPEHPPFFVDNRYDSIIDSDSILEAYTAENNAMLLHFFDGGHISIPDFSGERHNGLLTATGYVTKRAFETGRFEDMTLVAIAPLLRAHGYYLMHASGATRNGKAIVFVGGSGSGKTTTCLNLVLNGWQLLSNDVIILQERGGEIFALPMPDKITIRPKTLTLLPQLTQYQFGAQILDGVAVPNDTLPTHQLIGDNWAAPAPVAAICFPQVEQRTTSHLSKQLKAVTAARLLEESLDCWDAVSLEAHTAILTAASNQAAGYQLHLGTDIAALPALLEALLQRPLLE